MCLEIPALYLHKPTTKTLLRGVAYALFVIGALPF
jgi:hypothetical protein